MFYIKGPVGNNLANDERDVVVVKDALERLKIFNEKERNGFITRELDSAIKGFQKDKYLRVDGLLFPGGETEKSVRESLKLTGENGGNMPAVPPDSVQSEPLARPNIPGTNIPDHGIPEQGNPDEDYLGDRDKWRYEIDPGIIRNPPNRFNSRMPIVGPNRPLIRRKRDV